MSENVLMGINKIRDFITLNSGVVSVCKRDKITNDIDFSQEVEFVYQRNSRYEEFTMTDSNENSITIKYSLHNGIYEATRFTADIIDSIEIDMEDAVSEMLTMIPE